MIDSYKHQGLRKLLVDELREKGITNQKVLDAINKIPRHLFMENAFISFAYQDKPFPIGADQTISQPYTVAYQTNLLEIKQGDKILEIGTGCGYQTAVLCLMGAKVFSIERQKSLYDKTKQFLPTLNYKAKCFYGDGYKGQPVFAPYDGIVVTCGAPLIPEDLKLQLKIGAKLVIPVGESVQIMHRITRMSDTEFEQEVFGEFRFVPMLDDKAKSKV